MEPPKNGHIGDEHSVHCSEVSPSSEIEMYGQYKGMGANSLSIVGRLSILLIGGSTVYTSSDCESAAVSVGVF